MKKLIFITLIVSLYSSYVIAADRYWISNSNSTWNSTANWSATSGGASGASVPGVADIVYFDANGTGTCTLDVNASVDALNMSAGTLNTSTFTFTTTGTSDHTFSGGTVNGNNTFNIHPTGTARVTFSGTTFNPAVDIIAPRIRLSGSTFNSTSYFEKSGASDDAGTGGNTFVGNSTVKNTGSGYFRLGNGGNDAFSGDLDLINSGSSTLYIAFNNSTTTIAGDLTVTNSNTATNIGISYNGTSSLTVSGNCTVSSNTSVSSLIYLGFYGSFDIGGTLDITNGGTNNSEVRLAYHTSSSATITGNATIINNGANTRKRIYLGNNGDVIFNGTLNITNNSSADDSQIYLNHDDNSSNTYNENIVVEVTHADCDGIYFGASNGSGSLSATKTVTIGGSGYSAGSLYFRNFTQTGATAQNITLTGTGYIRNYDSDWGGNITFTAPRINTRGTTYNGTAQLEKTGATNDRSIGGNIFKDNTTINNSGTSQFYIGNDGTDDYQANLTINNTGSNTISIANHSPGTTTVAGNVIINNTSATTSGSVYLANDSITTMVINGTTTITNSGAGTNKRVYLGNSGDITFNGTLNITNSSSASNSQVYCNYDDNSSNTYNQNIVVEVTNADCDGILFGNSNGSGTLAASKTISVGGSGYSAGYLYFRNFTQTGATAQSITLTGTGYIYNYDSDWGGNITFAAPQMITKGTTYNGTVQLEKTGASNNNSDGGNIFKANTTLINSGAAQFVMGNLSADDFQSSLTMTNSSSGRLTIGNNSAGNQIANDLTINNTGTAGNSYMYVNNNAASTTTIGGNCTINNTGSADNNNVYLNNTGALTLTGNLTITNNATATSANVYVANTDGSPTTINGNTDITNSSSGTTSRVFLGNAGDVTLNGTLSIHNNTGVNNSQIYCNNGATSENTYNENIIVESSVASCDGVYFGYSDGVGTLAATKTITIGGGGFIAGSLYFRNFTQSGATAQALTTTGTGIIYNNNSNWGGNVNFVSPTINTLGTTYNGTAYIEKTGSTNDASSGGNTFNGNFTFVNSGSGYMRFGDGNSDTYSANVILTNTGTNDISFARQGAGHSITGDLTINNTGTSSDVYVADQTSATLSIGGNTSVVNSGGGIDHRVFLGNSGDVDFSGTLDISNSSDATNSYVYMNAGASSSNTYAENITIENTNADSDGIRFGNGGGSGVLAAGKTVSIKAGGFIAGRLMFRNFTQTGATAQSLTVTATADITNTDSDWGGDVVFTSPSIFVSGTTFRGTAYLEKTGSADNNSAGGNTFMGNVEFVNSGSGYLYFGSGSSSTFQADVTLTNSGSNNILFARQGAGHSVAGNLSINNSGNGSQVFIADNSNSSLSIGGNTVAINTSSGTDGRIYLGNDGDVTFDGDIDISNSSTATNSIVYIGNDVNNSDIVMNGNLSVENTNAASDGIYINAKSASLANTKTISLKAGGFAFGRFQIRNLTQTGTTAQSLELTGSAYLYLYDNTWGAATTFKAPRIYTRGSTYSGVAYLEKTDAVDDNSYGGNTFKENTEIVNSGSAVFTMAYTSADTYEKNLDITNSGSDDFILSRDAAATQILGDLSVQNINNAAIIYLARQSASSISITGTTTISNTSSAAASIIHFGNNGDITANGNCTFTNNASGTSGIIYIATSTDSKVTITGNTSISNQGANTTKRVYLGNNGDVTINGTLDISNTSTATSSQLYCSHGANSSCEYNGNITVSSSGANCQGVYFGNNQGLSNLANGYTLSIGGGGFSEGYLYLRNFTQTGATAQNLTLTSNGYLYLYGSNWGGNVDFTAPTLRIRSSTFDGTTTLEKNGAVSLASEGGNTYNGVSTITNSGSGYLRLANSVGNDYNANITFIKSGSGDLIPAYTTVSTFAGNLSYDYNSTFNMCSGASSWVEFDGTAAQSINNVGAANDIRIRRFKTNNINDDITLNIPLIVRYNLDLSNGNIISTATNYLQMNNDAVVDAVSDNAYVDGPMRKVGDDAFTFPVGGTDTYGNSHYAGIGISAPSGTNHSFTAQYHASKHASAKTVSAPLTKVSLVEYWDLDRTVGSGNINVTLYWGDGDRSGIGNLTDLRVAHWDGSTWEDKGNAATGGTAASGNITATGISSFSPFAFGTVDSSTNVLPVSLIKFELRKEGQSAVINWTTATEENNDYFVIERTSDFNEIEQIERIAGAGNSNSILDYSVYDNNPLNGTSNYRLVQFDYDGAKTTYDWKSINFANFKNPDISIFPNPIESSSININLDNIDGKVDIELLDLSGRVVYNDNINLKNSNTLHSININLNSGVYFARAIAGANTYVRKFVVK